MTKRDERGNRRTNPRRFRLVAPGIALVVGIMAVSGCESLLEVELPGELTTEDAFSPSAAATVVDGVISSFECGFSALASERTSMESVWWRTTGWWGSSGAEFVETRAPGDSNCQGPQDTDNGGWYMQLQGSRWMAEQIYEKLTTEWTDEQVDDRLKLAGTAATYAGLAYQNFGELFCEFAANNGPLMTPAETLVEAEGWFDRALQQIGSTGDFSFVGTSSMEQLAHLGRARVRFALGTRYADASAQAAFLQGAREDAELVQPGFIAWVTRDASVRSRWNGFYRFHNEIRWGTIADQFDHPELGISPVPFTGYRNLTIDALGRSTIDGNTVIDDGVPDPRVPVEFAPDQFGHDGIQPMWYQRKYTSLDADYPLARWAEAQLILAEIEGGQAAVDRVNALRDVHGLPNYTVPSPTAEQIQDLIIEERRREFFIENRHWADKLRYDLWFPEGVGSAIPEWYGYGRSTCMLMPQSEYDANPNVTGDGSQHLP